MAAHATGYTLPKIFHSTFRPRFSRHVPSIDRGRRLACVYRPIPSSIKRVVGCSLAIAHTRSRAEYTTVYEHRRHAKDSDADEDDEDDDSCMRGRRDALLRASPPLEPRLATDLIDQVHGLNDESKGSHNAVSGLFKLEQANLHFFLFMVEDLWAELWEKAQICLIKKMGGCG